jgi:Transposase DDE domain
MEFIRSGEFMQHLFDRQGQAAQAARIVAGILEARSPRLSEVSQHMCGTPSANYKAIQRFIAHADLKGALRRLFQADAEFVIGDPTEMPRPQAYKTDYVGKLSDGETRGFWLLVLATPFRGRAIPCSLLSYSSRTIAQGAGSRNLHHWQAFADIKALLGPKPLVLDRDFSYLELLEYCVAAEVNFVIRLNLRSQPPKFYTAEGREVILSVGLGQKEVYQQLRYKNKVPVNLIGVWRYGMPEPLWVMSNLAPQDALRIYHARMKIDESFKDLKNLLGLDRLMNKSQQHMEQMAMLTMLAYAVGLLVGETLRDELYPPPTPEAPPTNSPPATDKPAARRCKWQMYSGLFILLKHKLSLPTDRLRQLIDQALQAFAALVCPPVRT